MAFDKKKNGAWMEPEEVVERYDKGNGYWVDCKKATRYKEGAWTAVWEDIKWLKLLSNDITTGACFIEEGGLEIEFFKYMDYQGDTPFGTISGGGTMILYVEGEWTGQNTISFDYLGGFQYHTSGDYSTEGWRSKPGGEISLYAHDTNDVKQTVSAVTVGKTGTGANAEGTVIGSYEGTISTAVKFTRLGLAIKVNGYNGNFHNAELNVIVSNLRINGKKIGFPESVGFDNQEWL